MTRFTALAVGLLAATALISPAMAQEAVPLATTPQSTTHQAATPVATVPESVMTRTTTYHSETFYEWNSGAKRQKDFYLAAQAGGNFPTDDLKNDVVYGLAAGWYAGDNVRLELEGAFRNNDVKNGPGHSDTWSSMLNAYWDFNNSSRFTPYIGLGAGWAFNKVKGGGNSERDNNFMYQAIAGTSIDVTDSFGLTLDYRFVDSGNFEYSFGKEDYRAHEVRGGVRYSF